MNVDLVLEGGGVKGIALVGAFSVITERGYSVQRVAGTSAGAIVGSLVAAGYSASELQPIMKSVDYLRFRDGNVVDHLGVFGKAANLALEHGIYEGNYLKSWLHDLLAAKNVATFTDVRLEDPGSSLPVEKQSRLIVMTSDISNGLLRRLPWDYPAFGLDPAAIAVVDAVRASMSIPFFYQPVKLQDAQGQDCWFVDGGMLSNYPIDVFDRTDGKSPRWPTFGLKLSAKPEARQGVVNNVHDTIGMTKAMVQTMTSFYDAMHVEDPAAQARTIFIDTMKVRATDFDIDAPTQQALYDNGRKAADLFFDGDAKTQGWDWDRYLQDFAPSTATTPGT